MSYASYEQSSSDSRPVELYEISAGGTLYRLTSDHEPFVYDGQTYEPVSMMRSAILINDVERNDLTVTVDATLEFVRSFVTSKPSDLARMTIYRTQYDVTGERIVLFSGPVTGVTFTNNGAVAEIKVATARRVTNRPCPFRNFGKNCSLSLYGPVCAVDPEGFRLTQCTVADADGRRLIIPQASTRDDGYFTYGSLSFIAAAGLETRSISSHVGDMVELAQSPPRGLIYPGLRVDLLAGCDRALGTCSSKFNNLGNFGGFPYVPDTNPTQDGIDP